MSEKIGEMARMHPMRRLQNQMLKNMSIERFMLMRNFSFGASVLCIVILIGLLQVIDKTSLPFQLSTWSSVIAAPLWFSTGLFVENYIFLGKRSYPHLRSKPATYFLSTTTTIASVSTFGAIAGCIALLMPAAAWTFIGVSCGCYVLVGAFHFYFAKWWCDQGPGNDEDAE